VSSVLAFDAAGVERQSDNKTFKAYWICNFRIDIAEVRTVGGKLNRAAEEQE
jgi:hypothetical protein